MCGGIETVIYRETGKQMCWRGDVRHLLRFLESNYEKGW